MSVLWHLFKCAVAALVIGLGPQAAAQGQDVDLAELLAQLADPETQNWQQIERQIRTAWSRSGSAAMDLLLQRGEKALSQQLMNLS